MLKIRTGYSFRAATGTIDEVMSRLVEIGAVYAPISDRASTFGWARWTKAAKKHGLIPVYGVELAVVRDMEAKKPSTDYWTFFAIDDIAKVNELVLLATNQFYYEPRLSYEQAAAAKDVVKIIGSNSDLERVKDLKDAAVGLSPSCSVGYIRKAQELGLALAATSDNKFPRQGDEDFYALVCGRDAAIQTYPQWIMSTDEWRQSVKKFNVDCDEALRLSNYFMKGCVAELKKAEVLTPEKPETLLSMCERGARDLGIDLNDDVYAQRLNRELTLIKQKNFEDYFYIIADMMEWARTRMICGPARGSSCGSLVCYLLRITSVDPIKYDLLFERFIDITRADLPDIDLDFSDKRRELVFRYMENKYGVEKVARLGTVSLYRSASALKETGAVLGIPKWQTDNLAEQLIVRPAGDPRGFDTIKDTLAEGKIGVDILEKFPALRIAERVEGHPRHYSQHAAGIVVTERPVIEYVAIDARTNATMCDKKDAEDLNLLKIDALGLIQLSVFEDTLEMAGLDMHFLETVPLDDPAALDIFNQGKFSGIFQFNGQALQGITKKVHVQNLEDIVSITSLARPGPMQSGGTQQWINAKTGKSPIRYPHPMFEPYLKNTMGVITYQEQVMQICRNVGRMTWEDVTSVRKAIGKSMGRDVIGKYQEAFVSGAITNGIDPDVANKVFDDMCAYGAYGFNRSHAVAYAIVSYWCAYLKAHFPFEFAAATLTHETLPAKQIKMLREMQREGIDYIPVDIDLSQDKWTSSWIDGKRILVGPVQNVKGIGGKMVAQIMSSRARGEPIPPRAAKLLLNAKTSLDSLWPVRDYFNELMPDPAARNITTRPIEIEFIEGEGREREFMVFAVINSFRVKNENDLEAIEKRGYEIKGNPLSMVMKIADDTDEMYAKISHKDFMKMGKEVLKNGKPEKALYAIKGIVPKEFKILLVTGIRFIGYMEKKDD